MADKKPEEETETGEAAPAEEGEGGGKKSKKKLIIIVVLVLVLLIGGGAGAYFGGFIGHKSAEGEHGEEGAAEGEHGEGKAAHAAFFDIPELLVNLNTGPRQTSFLKMTIALELHSQEDVAIVQTNLPRIMDSFNTYLRELRASDLYGSAGIYRLREELLVRVNKAIAPAKANDILFKQILVQ